MNDELKIAVVSFFIAVILIIVISFAPKKSSAENQDVGLWLARSCVGEAGWASYKSGECAAIMHIYKKRSETTGRTLYQIIRQYSAATKRRRGRENRWVMTLNRDGIKPDHWPSSRARWERYKQAWFETIKTADDFLVGRVSDPLPIAEHYGSRIDHHRAIAAGWKRLKTPYRNYFYTTKNGRKIK